MVAAPPGRRVSLSVVLVAVGDRLERGDLSGIAAALDALMSQQAPPAEILIPHPASVDVSRLRARFPEVIFIPVEAVSPGGSSERAEELRAAGVTAARGEIIGLIEDHVRPDRNWCASILKAHSSDYAAIGGAIENGIDRVLSWAIYFTDLGRYQNPLPSGESAYASLVNISYKRTALDGIAASWQKGFNETIVHAALQAAHFRIGLSPEIVVHQYWPEAGPGTTLREFFTWGRNYGSARTRLAGAGKYLLYVCLSPLIPVVLLSRSGLNTWRRGRLRGAWIKALPASILLTLAWSCGELRGYLASPGRTPRAAHQVDPLQGS